MSKDAGGCSHPVLNRALVGRDAAVLAREAGATVGAATPMLFAETELEHPFVMEEQMMPMLPVVRVKNERLHAMTDQGHEIALYCFANSSTASELEELVLRPPAQAPKGQWVQAAPVAQDKPRPFAFE